MKDNVGHFNWIRKGKEKQKAEVILNDYTIEQGFRSPPNTKVVPLDIDLPKVVSERTLSVINLSNAPVSFKKCVNSQSMTCP